MASAEAEIHMRRNDPIAMNMGSGWGVATRGDEVIIYLKYMGEMYGVVVDPDTVRGDLLIAEECVKMPPDASLSLN